MFLLSTSISTMVNHYYIINSYHHLGTLLGLFPNQFHLENLNHMTFTSDYMVLRIQL